MKKAQERSDLESRGEIPIKGKGTMTTFFVAGDSTERKDAEVSVTEKAPQAVL